MHKKIGLVLEGGGFRGLYSAGILDGFLKYHIEFPYIIGVSMGACNAVNYISKQYERSLNVPYTYINDKRYMSFLRLLTKGELFGMDFIFRAIPHTLIPFDFERFYHSQQQFVVVTSDCRSGKPFYIDDFNKYDLLTALKASSSLPFASKMINIDEKLLLDGGVSDPIPIAKAINDGCDKIVVVLTQPKGYRKSPSKLSTLSHLKYKKYPKLQEALQIRYQIYNDTLDQLEEMERKGTAFVIRPSSTIPIKRTEKNKEKLKEAYEMGLKEFDLQIDSLNDFLKHE